MSNLRQRGNGMEWKKWMEWNGLNTGWNEMEGMEGWNGMEWMEGMDGMERNGMNEWNGRRSSSDKPQKEYVFTSTHRGFCSTKSLIHLRLSSLNQCPTKKSKGYKNVGNDQVGRK